MRHPFQPNLRRLWMLLNVTLLIVYTLVPARAGFYEHNGLSGPIELFMFVAAAPSDLCLLALLHELGIAPGLSGVGDRFMFLVGLSVLGHFQWFYFIPLLLGHRKARPLTLNLLTDTTPAPEGVKTATPPGSLVVGAGASGRLVLPFDERGRSPVERVIQQENDDAPAG